MAKDLLDLTAETAPDLTDQLYLVTDSGTVDKRVTAALLLAIRDDHGVIYDAAGAITLSATEQTLIAATPDATHAVGFTVDETTGVFTIGTLGAGVLYKIEFNFVIPKGSLSGEEVYAQLDYEGAKKVIASNYVGVGAEAVNASVSGSSLFVANNSGDELFIEVGATATSTSQTPVEVNITLRKF